MSKICQTCKQMKSLESYGNNKTTKDKLQPACKICANKSTLNSYYKYRENYLEKQKKAIKISRKNPNIRFQRSKSEAKRRGLEWCLTLEEYTLLLEKSCHYCDNLLGKSIYGVALDRINNNEGYISNNVLPCCGFCNITRGSRFTVEENVEIIKLVLNLRGYNNNVR